MSPDYFPTAPKHIPQFSRYITLSENWDRSRSFGLDLTEALRGELSGNVETIALAGSFGRMEGSSQSDADYIMVVRDSELPVVADDQEKVQKAINDLGIDPPNKSGVFSKPRTRDELLESIGHQFEETSDVLGKRMLLFLESRPIYDAKEYETLLEAAFDKYAEYVQGDHRKEFVFLLNDIIRYFRYICVNYQETFWRESEKWPIRNLKLRHSRILMYSGLLFLIGESSKYVNNEKVATVRDNLKLTPLERIGYVYEKNGDFGFYKIVGLYNVFLGKLSDPKIRPELNDIDYEDRYNIPVFAELKANSDAFVSELARFLWTRRGDWSERFYEYLVF